MGGRWPYSRCFVGCCFWDLFNIAHSILVQYSSSFFSKCFVSVHVVHPYRRIDATAAWKKLHFILSDRSDFYMIFFLLIALLILDPYLIMPSLKQWVPFFDAALWHDSTWDWTLTSLTIDEHSNHHTYGPVFIYIYIYIYTHTILSFQGAPLVV